MSSKQNLPRWKIIIRAWPPIGALFVILSFLVTGFWLWHALSGKPEGEFGWLEPLAAFLAGTGAFVLAAILIFRRVDSARAEADSYGLSRGLATGNYFNFVRPLISALSDPKHPLHADVFQAKGHTIEGLVIGLPQSMDDFDPARHESLLCELSNEPNKAFDLSEIKINISGRPRPIFAKVALSTSTKVAIIVDIPTTLSVIADFATFFANQELDTAPVADDAVIEAREAIVATSQTAQFREVLTEFIDVMNKVGSMEARELSPSSHLHVVPLKRLRRRLEEIADH